MRKMSSQVDKVVTIFRTLVQIPALSTAKLFDNGLVTSVWSQRNLDRNKPTKIVLTQTIDQNLDSVADAPFGIDITNEIITAVSPQENMKAVIKEQGDAKEVKKQYLEIWKNRHQDRSIDLPALEIHGDVYADTEFGGLNWDKEETRIIYIAEKKLPKSEPFYKRQSKTKPKETKEDEIPTKGNEYVYKQEWGEQLVGKHLSVAVICHVDSETFTVIDWLPESWCPGQVLWSPESTSLVGVAWETEPRRLGLIFCTNRRSYIFNTTLDGTVNKISEEGNAVRSPRFSSDGNYLVWLQRKIGGPHHACHQIVKTPWPVESNSKVETVIDIVHTKIAIKEGKTFTGMYAQSLPKRCFASDGKRLLFSTLQKTEVRSYVVDINTGDITDISDNSFPCSTTVVDVHQDIILASRSSMKLPSQLIIARLPAAGEESTIKWKLLSKESVPLPDEISSATLKYLDLKHENVDEPIKDFTALFMGGAQSEGQIQPLIVWPHGGPHSSFVNSYSLEIALFTMLGFSILQVNYRGSAGLGEDNLLSLPGKIGLNDASDCLLAMTTLINENQSSFSHKVALGKSHGGYLVTMLVGLHPEVFSAAVAKNPVTELVSKYNTSDIPDSCSYEAGSEFNEVGPVSEELLLNMRKASPLVHAHNVKAPTLLLLGSKDKRVPYFQGLEFFQKLKANGCKTRALVYEDNHALSTSAVEIDQLINSALWLLEHTQ